MPMEHLLTDLFASNEPILVAIYGQTFFVLGLAVALQWRRESRLELARAVPLLAAFGLIQAFTIWGDSFIPQQEALLAAGQIRLLRWLQLLLMLAGFASLLQFGMRLNWDGPLTLRLPWLLAATLAAFVVGGALSGRSVDQVRFVIELIARPLLLFPGALLAAFGMRTTARQVEAMGLPPHIVFWLRIAGLSLGAYAIAGGLFVPLGPTQVRAIRLAIFGLPIAIPRLLAISVVAWAMIRALTIFRLELQRAMEEMGRLRALASDRQRIGRDLHDGTIQAIYGAGLLLENARLLMRDEPDEAERLFVQAMEQLNGTMSETRRYIFDLSDGEGELAEELALLVREMEGEGEVEIEYRLEGTIARYAPELRRHLVQAAREAIANARRHAAATRIIVSLRGEPDGVVLTVSDDGRGLPAGGAFRPGGRGIPNLRSRAALLGGTVRLQGRPGGGTTVELIAPYHDRPPSRPLGGTEEPYEASANSAG